MLDWKAAKLQDMMWRSSAWKSNVGTVLSNVSAHSYLKWERENSLEVFTIKDGDCPESYLDVDVLADEPAVVHPTPPSFPAYCFDHPLISPNGEYSLAVVGTNWTLTNLRSGLSQSAMPWLTPRRYDFAR